MYSCDENEKKKQHIPFKKPYPHGEKGEKRSWVILGNSL